MEIPTQRYANYKLIKLINMIEYSLNYRAFKYQTN